MFGSCLIILILAAPGLADSLPENRLNQHRVTSAANPAPEPGAENLRIPSLVEGLTSADDWYKKRRPQVLALWTQILGKLGRCSPRPALSFGDIRNAKILDRQEKPTPAASTWNCQSRRTSGSPIFCYCPRTRGRGHFLQ